ncbi:peptide ABC transporter substrate-binding protein [Virgibacillus phasianinus]|uniref:Peptide ABC transporter substrate-binding protein n=1 Tax=Virgibacillus phasianinus TaxID=2017483 RepID=A0A220U3R1_9BACI|nr:peptide ABC transporter substrate-binding protein [Virgibacillus phasianinus]ASK62556.1 peptide ABC transporter substrate-binding protein [Virgibacillus phasianinus]
MKLSKFSLLLTLGLLLSMLMAACSNDSGGETKDEPKKEAEGSEDVEQVFNLTSSDIIPTMDSSLATDLLAFQALSGTTEGLYRLGKDGEIVEGIATEHKVSEDALTWTFTLREDAVWSNGDPVTAHDFVYAWRRAVDPKTGSEYGPYMMGGVLKNATAVNEGKKDVDQLGVKADGDYTLVVTLEKPIPYFESLTTFGTYYPLNQKFVEEQGDAYATSSDALLSNGPFKLTDWKSTSDSWTLVKNEDYWDADAVTLQKINYDVVKDPQVGVDLYEKGKLDRTDLTSELVDVYAANDDYEVTLGTGVYFLKFNQTKSEALANKNIRKALSQAFNKQALVDEILNDGSIVAKGFVPKNFVKMPESGKDFREASGDLSTYDAESAKELWKRGMQELGKDKVELEFLSSDSETSKEMGEFIANQLEQNLEGLDITLKQVPFEQRLALDSDMDYQIQFSSWFPDYLDPYTFLNLWVTDGGNNKMGYSNPEYDELLAKTANELALKPVERYDAFLQAEKILFEDAAIAPVYQSATAQLVSPKMEGVINNSFGALYEYKWASVAK